METLPFSQEQFEAFLETQTLEQLVALRDEMHDVLIEIVAFLRRNGMKTKLRKTWAELIDEK